MSKQGSEQQFLAEWAEALAKHYNDLVLVTLEEGAIRLKKGEVTLLLRHEGRFSLGLFRESGKRISGFIGYFPEIPEHLTTVGRQAFNLLWLTSVRPDLLGSQEV